MSTVKDAVYLIDDLSFYIWGGLRPVWDYCGDGEGPENATGFGANRSEQKEYFLLNSDREGEVYVRRDSNQCDCERLTFEMLLETIRGDGLSIAFGSRDAAFLRLEIKAETLFIGDSQICDLKHGRHFLKLWMNMKSSRVLVSVDGKRRGDFAFIQTAFPYSCLKIGYGKQDHGAAGLYFVKLYANYLVNDACLNQYEGDLPDEYSVTAPAGSCVRSELRVTDTQDECFLEGRRKYTYISRNQKNAKTITEKRFERACGTVVLQALYLLMDARGKLTVALRFDGQNILSVYDEGEELKSASGKTLRSHHKNVWQTLRIYADTQTGLAEIWLNGKKTGTERFENSTAWLDSFAIVYQADEASSVMFSDLQVWVKPPEPEDYVLAPVIPRKKGDYAVGINVCSLWREGHHYGWDCISPYDDVEPILGFYDEGLPETADWEIKFLAEHGVDYMLYCWFSSEGKAPIRTPHNHNALINGHFYAKYADQVKFAILWEARSGGEHATASAKSFREILVPYWLDYFFSDDRYMRVDNKAVMSMFGAWEAERELGGREKMRAAFQYLRDEVKKLGYDDLILMGCQNDINISKEQGYDAFHAYHWYRAKGGRACDLGVNIERNRELIDKKAIHVVPTVSVGFNNIGWGGRRIQNLSCEDMYEAVTYCKDHFLPAPGREVWKSKLLHLSTWNEYGEGTYIMPSGLNGFGYLDAVRQALCVDEPHEDTFPTVAQKERIGYLYPQDRYRLRRTKYDAKPLAKDEKAVAQYFFRSEKDLKHWSIRGVKEMEIHGGVLRGTSGNDQPELELKDAQLDASSISFVRIVCANKRAESGLPSKVQIMIANQPQKKYYKGDHNYYEFSCNSAEKKAYTVQLDHKSDWAGTIYGLKVIPIVSGSFEIESVTFYAAASHISVYDAEGREIFFGDYPPILGGELFIPLDPSDDARQYEPEFIYGGRVPRKAPNGVFSAIGAEYDWKKKEGRLEIQCGGHRLSIVIGRAYAVKDGKNHMLLRPAFLKDGIPVIAFQDLAEMLDLSWDKNGSKIIIKRKTTAIRNTVSAVHQTDSNMSIENESGQGVRILFVGNSITRHGVNREIGWPNDWGMAASAKENDYVHQIAKEVRKLDKDAVIGICQASKWELAYKMGESVLAEYEGAHAFNADIIVMRLIENCSSMDFDAAAFKCAYKKLVDYLNRENRARVIVTTGFWKHVGDQTIQKAAEENQWAYVYLGDLGEDAAMRADGQFEHSGVACHPGDRGMKAIAEKIFEKMSLWL